MMVSVYEMQDSYKVRIADVCRCNHFYIFLNLFRAGLIYDPGLCKN